MTSWSKLLCSCVIIMLVGEGNYSDIKRDQSGFDILLQHLLYCSFTASLDSSIKAEIFCWAIPKNRQVTTSLNKMQSHPVTCHKGTDGGYGCRCTLSLTSALGSVVDRRHNPAVSFPGKYLVRI